MGGGILRLKKTKGGWRHYIELSGGKHDEIHCGSALEVQLSRWEDVPGSEKRVPDQWLAGRYESNLCSDNPKARLYPGYPYPKGDELACTIPLGARVRRPERASRGCSSPFQWFEEGTIASILTEHFPRRSLEAAP